jgi:hypothetical protein
VVSRERVHQCGGFIDEFWIGIFSIDTCLGAECCGFEQADIADLESGDECGTYLDEIIKGEVIDCRHY